MPSNWTAQSTNRLDCLANRSLTGQHPHFFPVAQPTVSKH